jgi:AcrR family transcriptional regulator
MARPRSEEKRRAILDAATRVFAERGIENAPTSVISKAAGIAEGSLFTYFKSKDELMSELYLELRMEFSRHLPDLPRKKNARTRLKYIWDMYLKVGAEHPEWLRVLAQLRASGKLFKENEAPAPAFVEVLKATRETVLGNALGKAPPDYLVLMMRAQAEITIAYINAHPERAAACQKLGFRMLWKGLTGK